jgi:hypothetical protein
MKRIYLKLKMTRDPKGEEVETTIILHGILSGNGKIKFVL